MLGSDNEKVRRETEYKVAHLISNLSDNDAVQALNLIGEVIDRSSKNGEFAQEVASSKIWEETLRKLVSAAIADKHLANLQKLERQAEHLEDWGILMPDSTMAKLHFMAGSKAKAVTRWERESGGRCEEYWIAKAEIEPYPGKISALVKINDHTGVVHQYEAHNDIPLDPSIWEAVFGSYIAIDMHRKAFEMAWEQRNSDALRRVALISMDAEDSQLSLQSLNALIFSMVENTEWDLVAKFTSSPIAFFEGGFKNSCTEVFLREHLVELRAALVKVLARSEGFSSFGGHQQRQICDFLRRFLRIKETDWRAFVSIEEAGSSFERGGRFTDALGFYEAVQKESDCTTREKEIAGLRWVVAKSQQLEHEKRESGSFHKEKKTNRRLTEIENELTAAMRSARIENINKLPEFPLLPEIQFDWEEEALLANAQPPKNLDDSIIVQESSILAGDDLIKNTTASLGDFDYEISRKEGRCNIKHATTLETAFVKFYDRKIGGEKEWNSLPDNEWICEEWRIRIRILDSLLTFVHLKEGLQLTIRI